ncbi:predicted protein [Sclerotinia sclerotiorum 1980 UF-70]|uniref:Uncharacterized protein n=2 Tax=Sclerotinia sclerotiorum (strain ATCC 18683 / 1980 / Ss-1) TaxID=665079 RepID=A7EZZ5_SCLS1|nr:predicted protein [Sclerotinia sclerotiorum 1980 UF-70]APA12121.1 hypothetical protein sscle_09g068910 [Sclerotinia sclerotiorum 1980 UF-70]EDN95037.1 predicted protein [Sclerotinia sclerotiorum 1980 UF-70]
MSMSEGPGIMGALYEFQHFHSEGQNVPLDKSTVEMGWMGEKHINPYMADNKALGRLDFEKIQTKAAFHLWPDI